MNKKIILTLIAILFSFNYECNAQSKKINYNYSKVLSAEHIFVDYNGNKNVDTGEILSINDHTKISLSLKFEDFDTDGNILNIEIDCKNKNTDKSTLIIGNFVNVEFYKVKNNNETKYLVYNELEELEFAVIIREKDTTIAIFDVVRMNITE